MKKILLSTAFTAVFTVSDNITLMAQNKITQTAGHSVLGEFAPKFAELNDNVLFGDDVWNDSTLSLHDRSMVTLSIRRFVRIWRWAKSTASPARRSPLY